MDNALVDNVLDSGNIVSEFEHQLRYCVHFWTNTHWKITNPPIRNQWIKCQNFCPYKSMALIFEKTHKGRYAIKNIKPYKNYFRVLLRQLK